MRNLGSLIIIAVGAAILVFGIIFIVQSGSAKQQIADDIAPLTLDEVDVRYDAVVVQHNTMRSTEEPKIQTGQAAPSAMYNYLSIQRTSLGLARTSIGLANFTRMTGIIDVIVGVGLLFAGMLLMQKRAV
ncbi:MAG: hypothetical protein A2Z74_01735 [Chloroflexi bacterium RBG_13_46_9]|jgi:hypothetical protein|nr:MAG: hypothetical protein A2Z74_01735 [Chloroflexi bacterium RBG_13_46_9]